MRKTNRKISRQKNTRPGGLIVFRHVCLWVVLAVAAYWAWLDKEVYETFETASWALPARVYARPLELHPGAPISADRLSYELDKLGYDSLSSIDGPGQYKRLHSSITFYSRGYEFWDGAESSRSILVVFEKDAVRSISFREDGSPINLIRTEPVVIGSINPKSYEDRILVKYNDLPKILIQALVAVEDHRFYDHYGFDIVGLVRAAVSNLKAGSYVQGGSTLTQQLVKNFYLTRERTLRRKITELLMAISLEFRFPKEKILEVYFNEVFLGQDGNRAIHGFGLASQFYFGKPLNELDVPEVACLIGMVKGPSAYNPRVFLGKAKRRRDLILDVMHKENLISDYELKVFESSPISIRGLTERQNRSSSAFLDHVKRQLKREYDQTTVREAGLKIYTSLDLYLQEQSASALSDSLRQLEAQKSKTENLQAASVIVDTGTGEILALLGGREQIPDGFNRALDANRQIGSMVKPFIYALALSKPEKYSLVSAIKDEKIQWRLENGEDWEPKNFDGKTYGTIPLVEGLTKSLNLATVNLGADLGISNVTNYLKKMGIPRSTEPYPSLLLGAVQLSPVQITEMFTVFANDGFRTPLRSILEVTTSNNEIVNRYPMRLESVMEPSTSALIRFALTSVMERGTGRGVKNMFDVFPVAGKTGTSDDFRDSWFVGFGSNRLGTVWIGRDDNQSTGLTGSTGAMRVWSRIMKYSGIKPVSLLLPLNISPIRVDLTRGEEVPADCLGSEIVPVHNLSSISKSSRCFGRSEAVKRVPRSGIRRQKQRANKGVLRWLRELLN